MSKTLGELATAISMGLGDLVESQATAASTATTLIDDSQVVGGSGEHVGSEILFTADGRNGATRRVTAFDPNTWTKTFAPALGTATATTDTYEMRRKWLYAEVVAKINEAIREAAGLIWVEVAPDTSLAIAASTYEYAIPAGFDGIYRVEVEVYPGDWRKLSPAVWGIVNGRLTIASSIVDANEGSSLRLSGSARPAELSARTDVCKVNPSFIESYCFWKFLEIDRTANKKEAEFWAKKTEERKARASVAGESYSVPRADTRWVW